ISTPEAPELLEGAKGVRYRFKAWSLDDSEAPTNPYTFTMDRPHSLMVSYLIEYQLEVSSIYGVPTGAGWYSAGSTATISIEPSEGIFIRHIFEGWSGDYIGSDSTATFPVNRPMQIEAVWKTSYVIVSVLIILITISFAAGIIIFASQRLKKSPSTE
ncbi:InlB B-repeat-containing protein, partial [[Eubacterium] cellulosolvens]